MRAENQAQAEGKEPPSAGSGGPSRTAIGLTAKKLPSESLRAYAAFQKYHELGPQRSLAEVAKTLGKSKSAIAAWSAKHHWQDRLAASSPAKRLDDSQLSTLNSQLLQSTINNQPSTPSAPSTINYQPLSDSQPSTATAGRSQPSTAPAPWQQLPGETNKNFAAFTAYLSLGPGRSLAKTAEATGRTKDQLAHWSQRWRWRDRASAYHAHLAAVERKATEDLVAAKSRDWAAMHETVRRQAWAEGEDLIALAQDFKTRWRESERLPDFGALIRALELAFRLKQFAAGMPSEIKAVNTTVTGPGGAPIRIELEAALNKIYGNPIPGEVVDVDPVPPSPAKQLDDHQPSTLNSQLSSN